MVQFAIPNSDPVASLTFEDVIEIDISTFAATDYISLSLPEFKNAKYTLAATFIDFTSHPKGNFGVGPTDQIAFSEGTFNSTQSNGDTELRIPISKLVKVNKAAITGIRFRLTATEETTFRCLSIRAIAAGWKYAPIDLDTLWHRVKRPPTPNGTLGNRTNLYPNPSGEKVIKMTAPESGEWVGTRELGTASIPAFAGEYRDKYEKTASGSRIAAETFKFPGAGTYVMSMYVFLNPEWDGEKVRIHFGNDFTKESETVLQESDLTKKGQWQQISTLVVVGSAELLGTFELMTTSSKPSSGAKSVICTDALMVEQASVAGIYFDGSFKGAAWTGAANASTSTISRSDFPAGEIEGESGFPTVFRSDAVQGYTDPEPVNLAIGAAFTTGSFGQSTTSQKNEFALFFRDIPEDNQTMVEMEDKLNGNNEIVPRTMADLDALGKQPDFGRALFDARDQEEIDLYTQAELDERTQYMLELKRDESEHTWMEVRIKWGAETASNQVTIFNADGNGYKWTGMSLEASSSTQLDHGKYILITNIENTMMRAEIYKLNQTGEFVSNEPVFDTGAINDDTLIKRRKGRFGWSASLLDGDAHIDNIKTRGQNFGEVVSKPFRSVTPVKGVQLYAGSTVENELITGFERTDTENMKLVLDPGASSGGKAVKVEVAPLKPLQGIASNTFLIDDPKNIRLSFDIKFPSTEIPGGGLSVYLLGPYQSIYPINISGFSKDTWTHVKCSLPEGKYQTGGYKLLLIQSLPVTATAWWIENLSARTYTVKWSARPHPSDAWNSEGKRWLEAGFTLNSLNGGVVFQETGNALQVRAQALRQEAVISDFKAIPQYATLGNIVFRDSIPNYSATVKSVNSAASEALQFSFLSHETSWVETTNALLADNAYAKVTPTETFSKYLFVRNCGFAIPNTAKINGVGVQIRRKAGSGAGIVTDSEVRLYNGAPKGTNLASLTPWTTSVATQTYGGSESLWELALTPALVNGTEFGACLKVAAANVVAEVDFIGLTVYYSLAE